MPSSAGSPKMSQAFLAAYRIELILIQSLQTKTIADFMI